MKLYKFCECFSGDKNFEVIEIEVEETKKAYIIRNRSGVVYKADINKLKDDCFYEMYCLENTPEIYINAIIKKIQTNIARLEVKLNFEKKQFLEWQSTFENLEERRKEEAYICI